MKRTANPIGAVFPCQAERISLAVVFALSRRCNLACTYCNMEAGPDVRTMLEPASFHAWISAFAALEDIDLGIQLHGGEPLLMNPKIEHYAELACDAMACGRGARLRFLGAVTNGTLLDAERARDLAEAGIQLVVSIDGPQHIHDRHRVHVGGRGSHAEAMRAIDVLRSRQQQASVLCVVTEPEDVLESVEFFIREGITNVKINPVRPEGRGQSLSARDPAEHATAMAEQFLSAARRIAVHNRRYPGRPVFEENLVRIMSRLTEETPVPEISAWTLMVDDSGGLWAHPGGYGVGHMQLLAPGQATTPEVLAEALGLGPSTNGDGTSRKSQLLARQEATFDSCSECPNPMWCTGFRPLADSPSDGSRAPDCQWRERLAEGLRQWYRESPEDAERVIPAGGR